MERIIIKELHQNYKDYLNKDIKLNGWIKSVRSSKNFGFIDLNDGTYQTGVQVVFDEGLNNFSEIEKYHVGAGLEVDGKVVESQGGGQKFEVKAIKVTLLADSTEDYPLQKKRHSFEFLRDIAHLRGRSNTFSAVFRVSSKLDFAIRSFFENRNFTYVKTPIISGSDCEGAGEMFRVTTLPVGEKDESKDFFGQKTGLTVSGQLNGEALALAFSNIYTFGPTFRAENSNTTRHAAEFWMLEPEIAFAELEDDMKLAEDMVKYIIKYVMDNCSSEMEFFNKFIDTTLLDRLNNVVNSDFGRITYTEAIEKLKESGKKFEYPVEWGIDLQTEHERYLTDEVYKKPVFVIDYPKDIKAFYMRLNDDGKTVAAMDLLVPGVGEIIGGSQREERIDALEKRMQEMKLNKEDYWWYLDLRKYGGVKHAGFGLGFERALMYITGMQNIRDVIPFPRTPKNAKF